MIVYHGSTLAVERPDVFHSRDNLDFGRGFYVTPLREQAEKWSQRFVRRGRPGIVSRYECDELALAACATLAFGSYTQEWLDFVALCRLGTDTSEYDVIMGGIANDKVFDTCELYFQGLIGKDAALQRLAFEEPNMQICFKNQGAIDRCLAFLGADAL